MSKRTIDIETGIESKTDYEDLEDLELEITSNNTLLLDSRSAKDLVLEDIASMVEFDMIRFSRSADPIATTIDQEFLTSTANWERKSMRDICARMPEVNHIHRVINKQFGLRARCWQVSIVINITLRKKDVCIIANINAGKSHVYQAIPVVTKSFVLVISSTITLMEDQVRISSKYCLYVSS